MNRRRFLPAPLLLSLGLLQTPSTAYEAQAPELALSAGDGHPVLPSRPLPGVRATWVDFWASWCTPCRLSFPWMNEMHDRYASQGLRIVAVNLDRNQADASQFLRLQAARFPVAFDPAAASAKTMKVQAMPSSFLVAPDRRIIYSHRGFRLGDRAELEQQFRNVLLA